MSDLLKQILSVLPQAQRRAIKSLIELKKKLGETPTTRSQQDQATRLYARIKSNLGNMLLTPRYAVPDQKISSIDHNKNMEDIYLDLNALYLNIDQLGKNNSQQSVLLNSEYEKSKAAIYKLINDVSVFSLRSKYLDFNEVKSIDFNINTNQTTRYPSADINPKTRLLQSKAINFTRAHLAERGARHTKVYTKTYAKGIKGVLSKAFTPSLMVDQKPETFWGTLVMADSPIAQVFDITTRNGDVTKLGVDGPVVEIYLQFSHIEQINTVRFLPFAEYPVDIIDVAYRSNPTSQVFYQIKDFNKSTTLDWEELNFDSVYAHEVRITIAQTNYKKVLYHLPRQLTINTDIFQQIFNLRSKNTIDNGLVPDSDALLDILRTTSTYTRAIELVDDLYTVAGVDSIIYPESKHYDSVLQIFNEIYGTIDPSIVETVTNNISQLNPVQQDEIIEINKYEYVLGMREVEVGHTMYSPVAYYMSDKYSTDATVSEVAIEVEERHTPFVTQWETNYQKTSVEWDLDLGNSRKVPIHPRNIVDDVDGIPAVKDERIYFESSLNYAYTRLGGYYSTVYRLKKDGNLIPPTDYSVVKITGATPKLKITLSTGWLDNSVYTVDYAVDPDSYRIQVLDKYRSEPLASPEVFTTLGSDNDLNLSKYPFINYEVVNLTGYFTQDTKDNSWTFTPPQPNIVSGQLRITPTILDSFGSVIQTGSLTGYTMTGVWGTNSGVAPTILTGNPNISSAYFGSVQGVNFGYFVRPMDSHNLAEINQFLNGTGVELKNQLTVTVDQLSRWDINQTGVVFVGSLVPPISGYLQVDYNIGIGIKSDNQVFALSENRYVPIVVTVGDIVANNITNYATLEHPSFSVANKKDKQYQYIQAGKKLYFNQPIKGQEIKVQYNWLTNYISLLGTLRCNKISNPDLTAKVNTIKILINNLVI